MKLHPVSLALLSVAALISTSARAAVHNYYVVNANANGIGSLVEAVTDALQGSKAGPATDYHVVVFDIPGVSGTVHTIVPSGMPAIDAAITVDGRTQDGYAGTPLIHLNGGSQSGFLVNTQAGFLTVRALAFTDYQEGLQIREGSKVIVTGCHFGVNPAGTAAAPASNPQKGMLVATAQMVQIGGTGTNEGNVISGHNIGIDFWGEWNQPANLTIVNNKIGTSRNGLVAIPNQQYGIYLRGYGTNPGGITIGGPGSARNVISGNGDHGILVDQAEAITVKNNFIGVAADGVTPLGNLSDGIRCLSAGGDIGGVNLSDGNVISGNGGYGVLVEGERSQELPDTLLRNNLIGTNAGGTGAVPNALGGVAVQGYAVLGASGAGNVISGNDGSGVHVTDAEALLLGNFIGVTRSTAALGNASHGIHAHNSKITVGQAGNLGNGNLIGGNGGDGIVITGGSALTAQGNYIGVTATGADIGNGSDGIQHGPWIGSGIMGITSIGGTGAGMGNHIAFNDGDGVHLPEMLGIGGGFISILGNSIWANGGLGIDLGPDGVTANDTGDTDSGANRRQNFPIITQATPTKILGTLNSTPATRFRIECYRVEADATGHGEGRYYLGAAETTTNSSGNATFGLTGLSLTAGQTITATASVIGANPDPANPALVLQDTSEFAQNFTVGGFDTVGTSLALGVSALDVAENAGTAEITVQRSGSTSGVSYVQYATSPGSATPGSDYTSVSGTFYFAAGETQHTISVPIYNDPVNETPQTFVVQLSNASGAVLLSPASALVTIINDDALPTVSLPATLSAAEGHSGDADLTFPITLSAPSEQTVTCTYHIEQTGTASYFTDYVATIGFVVVVEIPPGQTSVPITPVRLRGDMTVEPDETFDIRLSTPVNAVLGNSQFVATILNDDDTSPGVLQFSAAGYTVAENDGTTTITVTRTGGTAGPASVSYAHVGGTAVLDSDYLAANTSGTLNFAHGQSSASFNITLVNDYLPEGPETMQFQFIGITGAAVGVPTTTTLTITDSDNPGSVQFSSAGYTAAENDGSATITVTRTGGTDGPASVNYALAGGTAVLDSDYLAANTSGTLNFAHGQSSASFNITLVNDYLPEGSETMQFQLSGVTGVASGTPTTTTLTITDSDNPGSLRFSTASYSAAENAGSFTVTVTRTGGTDGPASVSYARTGGTATGGSDFLAATTSGTLNFAHGQASATFTITLLDDYVIEGPETITLDLSGATGAALGSPASATLTLADNETGHSISGRVADANGSGIAGATVVLTGSQNATFVTDATGNYNFVGVVAGLNYAVVVTAPGWTFVPADRIYQNLTAPQTDQDFTGTPEPRPELGITALPNGNIFLFWLIEGSEGWTLKRSTTLAAGSWAAVAETITQHGDYNQVTLPPAGRAFFRLDRPTGGGGDDEM